MTIIISFCRTMTFIRYDLTNAVSFNDGVWKLNYVTPSDAVFTIFIFLQK